MNGGFIGGLGGHVAGRQYRSSGWLCSGPTPKVLASARRGGRETKLRFAAGGSARERLGRPAAVARVREERPAWGEIDRFGRI